MFSGIPSRVFPSPSLQDIFRTPLESLGAEHRTFLIVSRIARLLEKITLSSIVKNFPRRKQSFQRSRSVDLCSLFDAV